MRFKRAIRPVASRWIVRGGCGRARWAGALPPVRPRYEHGTLKDGAGLALGASLIRLAQTRGAYARGWRRPRAPGNWRQGRCLGRAGRGGRSVNTGRARACGGIFVVAGARLAGAPTLSSSSLKPGAQNRRTSTWNARATTAALALGGERQIKAPAKRCKSERGQPSKHFRWSAKPPNPLYLTRCELGFGHRRPNRSNQVEINRSNSPSSWALGPGSVC